LQAYQRKIEGRNSLLRKDIRDSYVEVGKKYFDQRKKERAG